MDASDTRMQKAVQLAGQGKLEEALAEYQALLKAAPGDADVRQRVAELLEWLGRRAEAAAAYEAAAQAWAKVPHALRAVAACVAMKRLGASLYRTARGLADTFARPAGAPAPRPDVPGPLPILSWVEKDAFVALLEVLEVKAFFPGQAVVEEGSPGTSMFALVEGRAEVVRALEGGERKSVAPVAPGDFFGEMALLSEGPRLASVVARERAVLLEVPRRGLDAVVARHPSVGEAVEVFYRQRLVDNLLRSNPLFTRLPQDLKAVVAREFQMRSVPAGEVLLTQGQTGDAFYLLLRGRCTPWLEQGLGRRVALPELREGDVFGEISLLLDKPVSATVRADVPCVVLRLERAAFEKHLLSQPGLKGMLMRMGTERLQRTAKAMSGRDWHEGDLRV